MRNALTAHRRTFAALFAALIASSLAWPRIAAAGNRSFSPGSVIIPAQLEYQDGDTNSDGTIAAYGLIYTVLTKNKARVDAGKRPITFYWAVEPRKLSHHRCRSSTDTLPDYRSYNDDDGCDFAIQSAAGQPVSRLDLNFAEETNFVANGISYSSGNLVRSNSQNFRIGSGKKVVKYSGGAWIVDAVDRNDFLVMLRDDPDLAHFHKNGAGRHFVSLHSANASFEAYIQRALNQKPPLLAIVGKGTEQILTDYLDQAGLATAFGASLGGTPSQPNQPDTHGKVYDVLDPLTHFVETSDYPCGAINMPADPALESSRCEDERVDTFYKVLWAADWKIDSASKYPADWSGTEVDAKAHALANIASFVDRGNGLFAEDSSIVTFEGISAGAAAVCTTLMQCVNVTNSNQTRPFQCAGSAVPSRCDGGAVCYSCPSGQTLDDTVCPGRCIPAAPCPSGYEFVNGACYTCPSGHTLDKNNPNALQCIPTAAGCPSGFEAAAGGCYQCPVIGNTQYLLDAQPGDVICHAPCGVGETWDTSVNKCMKGNKAQNTKTVAAIVPAFPTPTSVPATGATAATRSDPLPCDAGFALSCGAAGGIVEGGSEETRFQTTGGIKANSISGTFSGADCNDYGLPAGSFFRTAPAAAGNTCIDYHPDDRVTALLFSQKGNFDFTATTGGNVQDFTAPSPSAYRRSTWKVVSSARVDASGRVLRTGTNAGLDFATMRHKDGDPSKGLVVYLSGHQYKFDFWGLRIILNTLLNLGLKDDPIELARSEPVGFRDESAANPEDRELVFQGSYEEVPPPLFNDWREFSPISPESWRFPFIKGHLHAYGASQIALAGQNFVQNQKFDAADAMPLPGARNIFTVLGGSAHLGWTRVNFDYRQTLRAGCVDVSGVSGECDVVEKLAEGNTAGVKLQDVANGTVSDAQRAMLGMFVQQVRGFCAAADAAGVPIMQPTDDQCTSYVTQKNVAYLGGIDHSSPAVVGRSRYVTDATFTSRPVVAYVGGRDGMLHALYVSGGSNFPGLPANLEAGQELWAFLPPGQIPWLATNNAMVDAAVNVIDVFGNFPADANDDGVIDWASDREKPDGIREWRTVLLGAAGQESKNLVAGQGGLELFALDVTDPLKPVLLWHVSGISEKDSRWDANGDGTFARDASGVVTEVFDHDKPATYALRWRDWDDGDAATVDRPAKYEETNATNLRLYHTGRFDYSNLGFTYGTSIGKVWSGNAYQYLAYIVTSSADFKSTTPTGFAGIDVFAIDLITGQKVWQWQKRYGVKTTSDKIIAANDIPGRPALADVDADGSVDRVYVSDLEGRMWELSALDGRNLIYWPVKGSTTRISLPLFGTPRMVGTGATDATKALFTDTLGNIAQQPLTSPIGLGRFTDTKPELRRYLVGRLALVEGTMGVNWALAPFEKGNVFVLPSAPEAGTRIALPPDGLDLGALSGVRDPRKFGVLHRADGETTDAFWTIELGVGERVYGMPRVVNNTVVFDTAFGDFTGDMIAATAFERGNLVIASKDGTNSTAVQSKSFAGVLVFGENVIVTSATGLKRFAGASIGVSEGDFSTRPFNRNTPAVMKTWELQAEITAPDLRR